MSTYLQLIQAIAFFYDFGESTDMYRAAEFALASLALLLLSPLFVLIALGVKCSSPGPILHRATRVGRYARTFTLYKFRSMHTAPRGAHLPITFCQDPRVTKIGAWLRQYKLDELPQLFNIILGQMSFVGPRPEDPRYVKLYSEKELSILNYKPGITSPASLAFSNEEALLSADNPEAAYIKEILPKKLALDLQYFQTRSLFSDLALVVQTVARVFFKRPVPIAARNSLVVNS
jgi:lipopolysaccharide/colanic/teichoic acid biosynthesis glycosyltransferase